MKRIILYCVMSLFLEQGLFAQHIQWNLLGGINCIVNTDDRNSDPSPITGIMGVDVLVPLATTELAGWYLAPSASLFYTRYLWSDEANRALPAAIENRTAIVPALHLDIPVIFCRKFSLFSLRTGIGVGMVLRYGFLESGVPATDHDDVAKINRYLWADGRFFYPSVQFGLSCNVPKGLDPGFLVRVALPVANLWTDLDISFADSMLITCCVFIRLK